MSAFHDLAEAFRSLPDIAGINKLPPDQFVAHERWTVKLRGWWLYQHIGIGRTPEEAYHDAKAKMADARKAA